MYAAVYVHFALGQARPLYVVYLESQRKHTEVKESLEFSEAERTALLDSNTELESQLKTLGAELQETRCALKQAKYVLFL